MRVLEVEFGSLEVIGLNGSKRDCFTRKGAVLILTKTRTSLPNRSRSIITQKAVSDGRAIDVDAYPPFTVLTPSGGSELPQSCKGYIEIAAHV